MRVVVVGAGVGGLATAVRLAALGHRVTVFERAETVGGKLGRLHREGFTFDTGPSLVTLPHVFGELLPELELRRLDPIVRHRFPDGSVLDSGDDFGARIGAAFGPAAERDWQRLWQRAARVWDASWRHVLSVPLESPFSVARQGWRLPDLAAVAPGRSLRGLGRRTLRDPRLRMLLDRYATYAGADPRRAPAALVAIAYAELHYGGWYVPGGLGRIADALLARAQAAGVTVHTGVSVTGISPVIADGVRIPADVVVANADAQHVYRDLLPDPRRLAKLRERSLAGFVLLMGVRGSTPGLAHHNVFFPADYDAEFDAVFGTPTRRPRPVDDPTVFVTAPDDPAVRPDGHEAWFVLVNAAPQSTVDWTVPGRAERYADRVLEVLAARGTDVRGRVAFREVRTPADLMRTANAPGGAIYGTPGGLMRLPNRGPAPGIFLVGGSVHPGGGLPMVLLSARHVAELIGPA